MDLTVNNSALKRWVLSLHTCGNLKDIGKEDSKAREVITHKEEMPGHNCNEKRFMRSLQPAPSHSVSVII